VTVIAILSVIATAMLVVGVVGTARFAWRIFHDNEEMVPGGSLSRQFLGRRKDKGARGWRKRCAG